MQVDPLSIVMIAWLIKATLQFATPLVLTALGGMYSERSGIVNIGLEGMMLIGAFSAVAATYFSDNPWMGILVSVIAGGMLAAIHAVITVKLKGDHIVSGTGVILFAAGFTTLMLEVIWGQRGVSEQVTPVPQVVIPGLSSVPFIGNIFGSMSPIVYMMFFAVIISWLIFYKTPFGLRLRAAGEDPSTLDAAGVNVETIRLIGVIISGCLAGLGGAYLSIGYGTRFGKLMTSGRGFIALAALIFGGWRPIGCFLAGTFFGFLEALQSYIQLVIPALAPYNNFIQMTPYILVVIALAGIGRSRPPKAVGQPYEKEKPA
ncbi:ABC transporter permease [Candidatus Thorarchaeota archaeon]|nr:MAG: ABC transporter permease [Candidatus Thorarchaeota archaeon]